MLGLDEKVFDVDAMHPAPCGEVQEPQGAANDLAGQDGHVAKKGGPGAEKSGVQLRSREGALVGRPLVLGELVDQGHHGGDVRRLDGANYWVERAHRSIVL